MKQKRQKENIVKNPIRWRLNGLFFMVFVLFSILILRLGVIQIIKGEAYAAQAEKTDVTPVSYSVPRGKIYDTNHKLIVYNIPEKAIVYTPPKNPQPGELLELAKKLNTFLVMTDREINKVTDRDLKDIWLLVHNNGTDLITKKEEKLYKQEKLNDKDLYQLKLNRISESDLQAMDKNLAAIYRKLSSAIALTPTMIKNENVTEEEYAMANENLENLPGVDVTTDWKRGRSYGEAFWNMLGEVTSADEGLPADKVEYYTSKGYKLNDRVGKSYIEELYDGVLQGQKKKVKTVTDPNGNVESIPTGIGFDNETAGIKGTNPSTYFQIAIGQLDTYTPMQIAQYITTIANGGYRMKPQLVKEIREPNKNGNEPGIVIDEIEPMVLNQVDMSEEMLKRVQQGFWLVTHGSKGTARGYFKDEPYNAAGKTGTSESYKNGVKTWNLSFAGYAPFNDPEIAIAVIVPNAFRDGYAQPHSAANIISQRVFRAYFNLNEKGQLTTK